MTEEPGEFRLQVLLGEPWRNEAGRAEVERILRALGMHVTGSGQASISARATPTVLAKALGMTASERYVPPSDGDVPVPSALAEQVVSLTIAPRHLTMSRDAESRRTRGS